MLAHVVGEAGHEQRVLDAGDVRDADRAAVQRRPVPRGRREQLVAHRVVDRARGQPAPGLGGDGDAEEGIVVGEVGGAVERVHHPAHGARRVRRAAVVRARLLGEDGVAGEALPDAVEHQALRAAVVLGDEVDAALALGRVRAAVALPQDGAGGDGQLHRGVPQGAGVRRAHAGPRAALWMQKRE